MKRLLLVSIALIIMLPLVAGVHVDVAAGKGFSIYAQMGEYMNVSFEMLQNNGYEGSPFDLMGNDVWPRTSDPAAGYGRRIATWSVMTNAGNRNLTITAMPLVQTSNAAGQPVTDGPSINYRLSFALNSFNRASAQMVAGNINVYSGTPVVISQGSYSTEGGISANILDNWINGEEGPVNMPYISQDQPVRVILMKSEGTPYTAEERSLWSSGMYQATITITITGGDSI